MTTIIWKHSKTSMPYAEIGQANPLTWWTLKQTGPDEYTTVSSRWKCKDFMNEIVVCSHTKENFQIYGFSTSYDMINPESDHFPLLVRITVPFGDFLANVHALNKYLADQGVDPIGVDTQTDESAEELLIKFPLKVLENTYFMSVYTLLLRLCNGPTWQTTEDLLKITKGEDKNLLQVALTKDMKSFPAELNDYIVYYSPLCGLKKGEKAKQKGISTGIIHNTGLMGWGMSPKPWNTIKFPVTVDA